MGRGDNRRTRKMRQRRGLRRKKTRLAKKIEDGKARVKAGGRVRKPAQPTPTAPATVRRTQMEGETQK